MSDAPKFTQEQKVWLSDVYEGIRKSTRSATIEECAKIADPFTEDVSECGFIAKCIADGIRALNSNGGGKP